MQFPFEKTPRISLSCKLVPVKYREYKYCLLFSGGPSEHSLSNSCITAEMFYQNRLSDASVSGIFFVHKLKQ